MMWSAQPPRTWVPSPLTHVLQVQATEEERWPEPTTVLARRGQWARCTKGRDRPWQAVTRSLAGVPRVAYTVGWSPPLAGPSQPSPPSTPSRRPLTHQVQPAERLLEPGAAAVLILRRLDLDLPLEEAPAEVLGDAHEALGRERKHTRRGAAAVWSVSVPRRRGGTRGPERRRGAARHLAVCARSPALLVYGRCGGLRHPPAHSRGPWRSLAYGRACRSLATRRRATCTSSRRRGGPPARRARTSPSHPT